MIITERNHRFVEVKRSHDCAMIREDSDNSNIVLLYVDEIPKVIMAMQGIYEKIKYQEGEANSMMHDPPIPF